MFHSMLASNQALNRSNIFNGKFSLDREIISNGPLYNIVGKLKIIAIFWEYARFEKTYKPSEVW